MTIRRIRWRIARLIAPLPIIAAPPDPGPAILLRENGSRAFVAWVTPKTLDITTEHVLSPIEKYGNSSETFLYNGPSRQRGVITGTI